MTFKYRILLNIYLLILLIISGVDIVLSRERDSLRIIEVTAAADEEFRSQYNWIEEIRNRMEFVSKVFEQEVGIRFNVIHFRKWNSDNSINIMQLLIRELKKNIPKEGSDIVIGFTSQYSKNFSGDYDDYIAGLAYSFQDYVLIRTVRSENWNRLRKYQSIIHELGHLFGAVHVKDVSSIMHNPIVSLRAMKFDKYNKQIIKITKKRDFNKGIESLSRNDIERLINLYQKIIEINPEEGFPYFYLSLLYSKKRMPEKGELELKKALKLNKSIAQNYVIPVYLRRIKENPDNASAYNDVAYAYFVNGLLSKSVHYNRIALKINPYLPESYNLSGLIYLKKKNIKKAIIQFKKAVDNYPLYFDGHFNLGKCYYFLKYYKKARDEFELCIKLKPESAEAHIFLGLLLMKEKKLDEAIFEFKVALFYNPSILEGYRYSGDIYFEKGEYQLAFENYI
ncbi:hypothetical protein DRQ09_03155, partial [candidate division KSB1 bacterium]